MSLLTVDNITVRYGRLTALRGASLAVAEGETLFITGPNGAGKSTLLKAIAGVVPMAEGSITLDGKVISGGTPEDTARLGFSLVPEGRHVFGSPHHRGKPDAGCGHAQGPRPRRSGSRRRL